MDTLAFQNAIGALYEVFQATKPKAIDGCSHCLDRKDIGTLLGKELRDLTADDLTPYASSVFLTVGALRDFKYFLPRILEISASDRSWVPDKEVVLKSLRRGQWETWSVTEREAINGFLMAWWDVELAGEPPDGWEIDSLVCGLALAGAHVEPFLARILEKPLALTAFYKVNSNTLLLKRKLTNAFWTDDRSAGLPVIAFLQSSAVQSRLLPN